MSRRPNLNKNKHSKLMAVGLSQDSSYLSVDIVEIPLNKHIRLSE
jgi:hypothetical protein